MVTLGLNAFHPDAGAARVADHYPYRFLSN